LPVDEHVTRALEEGDGIDITTRGRNTRQPRRIEIRFHKIHRHVYLMGTLGRSRHWSVNVLAHPEFTFHLNRRVQADLRARATPVVDQARRHTIIAAIHQRRGVYRDGEVWVEGSPLVAVELLVE